MASRIALQPTTRLNCGLLSSPLDSNPSCYPNVSSQFRLKVRCHPFSWMPASRCRLLKAARFQTLRHIILNASAAHLNEEFSSGNEHEDKGQTKMNIDTVLVVSESFCITAAAAACVASITMKGAQESRLVAASALQPLMPQKTNLPIWQSFFLLAALVINAILRARQWQGKGNSRNLMGFPDSSAEVRLQKLEEDTASVVTIVRVLSKQLEKLAVRFRVTRQTLRDPIQETAILAQKTSESVNILAAREDDMEKSLEEIHHVLLGMQENQTKQLELISTLGKLAKERPRDKSVKGIKVGRNGQAGTQQGGMVRFDSDDGASRKNISEKLGSFVGNKSPSAKLVSSQKMVDGRNPDRMIVQGKIQSEEVSNAAQSNKKVDYWLSKGAPNSKQKVEEPVSTARSRDYLSNDGRARSTFTDSTSDSSFHHGDSKEYHT